MYIIVTGAAGFVGANLIKNLNEKGINEIIAVDNLKRSEKFRNLVDCDIADYFDKSEFLERLSGGDFDRAVDYIFHQGACSDTMEQDGRYMMDNNFRYSQELLNYSLESEIPLLYASSAAVYGKSSVFRELPTCERPINVYAYSKLLFDQVVRRRLELENPSGPASQLVGLRYFNVYGPREQHKQHMASVAYHHFHQYQKTHKVQLFSGSAGYADGEQRRDFIHVDDVIHANLYFYEHRDISGIFNIGTGHAESFNQLAVAVVNACRKQENLQPLSLKELIANGSIEYIPFPDILRGKYQSFTQADISALRDVDFEQKFLDVDQGVARYVIWLHEFYS